MYRYFIYIHTIDTENNSYLSSKEGYWHICLTHVPRENDVVMESFHF